MQTNVVKPLDSALPPLQIDTARHISTARLGAAISNQYIVPVFQPIVDLRSGQTVSCEVLARWEDDNLGPISPEIFIPLAEQAGLLDELMTSVLRPVTNVMRRSDPSISMAINISPNQLKDPWFATQMFGYLHRSGLQPHRLIVEITEGVLIEDFPAVSRSVQSLRAQGIRFALDDFGTGYSNLSYLCSLDVDSVKIDRCFVSNLDHVSSNRKVIQAVVGLGAGLGFSVVAEGIETAGQASELAKLGCNRGQGFLYAKPMSGADFIQYHGSGYCHSSPLKVATAR
jgi:EAL domain-containing protein (putative c-di-GMP-specific phosphodiesterase class I)